MLSRLNPKSNDKLTWDRNRYSKFKNFLYLIAMTSQILYASTRSAETALEFAHRYRTDQSYRETISRVVRF